MECSCIKHRDFNIHVEFLGCEKLILEDQSVWIGETPEFYFVKVDVPSRPSRNREIKLYTGKRNIFTTKEFFGDSIEKSFPDEIYCLETTTCNNVKLTISRAVMCKSHYSIQEIVSKKSHDTNDSDLKNIFSLKLLYEEIAINAERGNVNEARVLHKILKDRLKAYNCELC